MQYKGKPIMPTKTAMDELSDNSLDLYDVAEILEYGFDIRKRQKNIIERGISRGNKVFNIVIIDMVDYYKLIHAGKFSLSRKFKKKIDQNKNEL